MFGQFGAQTPQMLPSVATFPSVLYTQPPPRHAYIQQGVYVAPQHVTTTSLESTVRLSRRYHNPRPAEKRTRPLLQRKSDEPDDPVENLSKYNSPASEDENERKIERRRRRRERKRSRSASRSKDRPSRRSRRRSRSRSSSRDADFVYVNPARYGTSVSALLTQCNRQEELVKTLNDHLAIAVGRIQTLDAQIIKVSAQHDAATLQLRDRVSSLEQELECSKNANIVLQAQCNAKTKRVTALEAEVAVLKTMQSEVAGQEEATNAELQFLKGRNQVLLKKCEELMDKNRSANEQKDAALKMLHDVRTAVQAKDEQVRQHAELKRRLENDVAAARNKETLWRREREDLQRRILEKDRLFSLNKQRFERELQREKSIREQLQHIVHGERGDGEDGHVVLGIDLLSKALDVARSEIEEQMRLFQERLSPVEERLNARLALYDSRRRAVSEPRL